MKAKMNYQEALSEADHVVRLDELKFDTMLYKIASAMIKFHGFYAYIDAEENLKIFVNPPSQ